MDKPNMGLIFLLFQYVILSSPSSFFYSFIFSSNYIYICLSFFIYLFVIVDPTTPSEAVFEPIMICFNGIIILKSVFMTFKQLKSRFDYFHRFYLLLFQVLFKLTFHDLSSSMSFWLDFYQEVYRSEILFL